MVKLPETILRLLPKQFFGCCLSVFDYFVELVLQGLTQSFPMHPFLPPENNKKNSKVFWCFQEAQKGCIGSTWVKSCAYYYSQLRNERRESASKQVRRGERGLEKQLKDILPLKERKFAIYSFFSWWTTWWLKKGTNYNKVPKWNCNFSVVFKLLYRCKVSFVAEEEGDS